jgi:hypothetical protein
MAVAEIQRVLKKGGWAILSIPTWDNTRPPPETDPSTSRSREVKFNFQRPFEGHMWNFSTKSFLALTKKSHLKLVRALGVSYSLSALPIFRDKNKTAKNKKPGMSKVKFFFHFNFKRVLDKIFPLFPNNISYARFNILVFRKEVPDELF